MVKYIWAVHMRHLWYPWQHGKARLSPLCEWYLHPHHPSQRTRLLSDSADTWRVSYLCDAPKKTRRWMKAKLRPWRTLRETFSSVTDMFGCCLWGMTSLPQHLYLFKKNLFDVWNTRSVTRFTFRTLSLMHRYVWYHSVYSLTALTFHLCDIVKSPATVQVQTFALIRLWKEAVREKDAVIIIKTLKVCKYIQIIS